MTKRMYCADIEADGLLDSLTELWCASFQEISPNMENLGKPFTYIDRERVVEMFCNPDNILVMHNGISYDKAAIEMLYKIEVTAEIVDTLYLSWYLYPKVIRHGLAFWGEELGVAKPEIDNWETLTRKEYIHRCEEDVKIQTLLWKQVWKHLMLLYMTPAGCWHLIRHLNFKAKCAAMQESSKIRLNVKDAEEQQVFYDDKFGIAKDQLERRMPKVPVKVKKARPKKPYKANGELSAIGVKWKEIVEKQVDPEDYDFSDPMDYDGIVEVITKYKEPNAGSSTQLKNWLYDLGWEPESFNFLRNKETNEVRQIPQIKNSNTQELCVSIERLISQEPALDHLREMSVVKHRSGIVKGLLNAIDSKGFVIAGVQGLTNTLRFKHRTCVNLPSARKPYGLQIRRLLMARNDKLELCGSDMCSLEDRTKQHYMWKHDKDYVLEMQKPGFDPHIDMAKAARLFKGDDEEFYKGFDVHGDNTQTDIDRYTMLGLSRHAGKSTNYAATYGARGPAIARAAGVEEIVGEQLLHAYWERNWSLTSIANECLVKNSRGMKWLWNPVARLWLFLKADKDKFSTLNQSTGTYCFDRWVYHILERRPQITAQFHDEVVVELKIGNRKAMTKILKDSVADVNKELNMNRALDCDVDFGRDYSQIH